MAYINLNNYMTTPAAIFDLQGRCWLSDRDKGVPCRIKVGPRRWLTEYVIPEELGVTIWQEKNGQTTYLRSEPVQTAVDKDSVLTVDMAAFAKEYFGKDHVHFCDSDHWKWYKNEAYSDTFLTNSYGIATHRSTWLDISVNHSHLYLMPGTLTLCGHDVRHIYWETFCEDLAASGEAMRPLVETILSGPHTVTAKAAIKRLKQVKPLKEWGFNRLHIRTDRGTFAIGVGLAKYLKATLNSEDQIDAGYAPNPKNTILQDTDILLQLLAADEAAIHETADVLCQQGLLVQNRGK